MNTETEKDEMMRRYLLDEMADEERQAIEEKFLDDDSFFEEITAYEDELLYEYKQNRLTEPQRIVFAEKFLKTPLDQQKAEFAEAFLEVAEEIGKETPTVSFWQSIAVFFSFSNAAFRIGAALATVLVVFGLGIWLINDSSWQNVVVELPTNMNMAISTPIPPEIDRKIIEEKQKEQDELDKKLDEEKQKNQQNTDKIREIELKREKLQREIDENQKKKAVPLPNDQLPQKSYVALILSPGTFNREGGEGASKIKLTPDIKTLKLSLKSKAETQNYRVIIRAIDDDREVWTGFVQKKNKKTISLNVPAQILQRADYEISLINQNDNQEIESYYFSVLK